MILQTFLWNPWVFILLCKYPLILTHLPLWKRCNVFPPGLGNCSFAPPSLQHRHNRETNKHINTQIQSHVLIISPLIHTFTLSAATLPPLLSPHLSLQLSLIAASHPSRRLLRLLFLSFSPAFLLSLHCRCFPLSPLLFPSVLFRSWRISLMIKQ